MKTLFVLLLIHSVRAETTILPDYSIAYSEYYDYCYGVFSELMALYEEITELVSQLEEKDQLIEDLRSSRPQPQWNEWSEFRACPAPAGRGAQVRSRMCVAPDTACPGPATEGINQPEVILIPGEVRNRTELLSTAGSSVNCAGFVPDLPVIRDWGTFFQLNEELVFCSGYGNGESPCFKYSSNSNSWQRFRSLPTARKAAAVMQLNGDILITGGHDGRSYLDTTDTWNPQTEQFEPGPLLPYAVNRHCVVEINYTHAVLTGGYNRANRYSDRAFMFNKKTEEWTEMERMHHKRRAHACGLVNKTKVVVAGGYNGFFLSSVEIYDLETHSWSRGPDLPYAIHTGTSVQLEATFLIVGGYSNSMGRLDTVYEYVNGTDWLLWQQRMNTERDNQPAVYKLPADHLNCVCTEGSN